MSNCRFFCMCTLLLILISGGCRLLVPIYVWDTSRTTVSPKLAVAIGNLEGSRETVDDFFEAFSKQRPQIQENIAVLLPQDLTITDQVQLASTAAPLAMQGEIGALQAAKRNGTDLLLFGEVLRDELRFEASNSNLPPEIQARTAQANLAPPEVARRPEHLTIAWRMVDTTTGENLASYTASMDRNAADKAYPELIWEYPDAGQRVIAATARETWKAIGPHVVKEKANLSASWMWPGSKEIRKGVVLAKMGRWMEAEDEWRRCVETYPNHHKAWHNLALAAAAREDFVESKRCIRRALMIHSCSHYETSFQWIELRQREYHEVFALPPPLDGWAFPEPTPSSPKTSEPVKPLDLDAEPWWRVIPGVKPPEWTWYAWLTQPLII